MTAYVVSAAPGACVYADDVSVTFSPHDVPPTADLTARPSLGTAELTVTADASRSSDPDTTPIASYSFGFGDGSAAVGPQAGPVASHTYTAVGTYTITVSVQDWNTSGSGTAVGLTRSSPGRSGGSSAQLTNIRLR